MLKELFKNTVFCLSFCLILILSPLSHASDKPVKVVSFDEPDYDLVAIYDQKGQVVAQHHVQIEKSLPQRDINSEVLEAHKSTNNKKSKKIPSFENAYKSFQNHYDNEMDDY